MLNIICVTYLSGKSEGFESKNIGNTDSIIQTGLLLYKIWICTELQDFKQTIWSHCNTPDVSILSLPSNVICKLMKYLKITDRKEEIMQLSNKNNIIRY